MVDVVFTGGRVVDVRTCTSRIANVAVEHGKIVDISAHELPAKRVVDAAGLVVAPGFIDVHGHLDGHAYAGQLSAMQGITTTVGGNCGLSPLDLEGWFAGQARTGYVLNQAELVGHSFSMRRQNTGAACPCTHACSPKTTFMPCTRCWPRPSAAAGGCC